MTTERIKEIQEETCYPDSVDVQRALLKVWNECVQSNIKERNEILVSKTRDKETQYQKLTKFQKEVVDALINLGFKHKYFSTYELIEFGDIEVDKFSSWSDVLKNVHEQGKDQKRFEIQRALGL